MAGHSKWANIKHRKGKADAIRGKLFSRASKEIINAVKLGGPDPKINNRLRIALEKAREVNFPQENIERAIKKASSQDQESYIEMQYELYGHGGVGIIVDIMSDNKNRISSDIHIATNKRGGTVATPGSVGFNFDRKGILQVPKDKAFEDELFSAVIDAGAEDFSIQDDAYVIICDPQQLNTIKEAVTRLGCDTCETSIEMLPKLTVACDPEAAQANLALIEWLERIDDVEAVYHNMES